MVNPNSSAVMKMRTVQPDDAAEGPHLHSESCAHPAPQLSRIGEYEQALSPPSLLAKQIESWTLKLP